MPTSRSRTDSGTLVTARSGQSSEAGPATGDIGASNLAGDPASIVLSWVGCPSDTRHVLTIAADRRTMTLDQPVCQGDTLGVDRVLVLTFDSAVPAADVAREHQAHRRLTRRGAGREAADAGRPGSQPQRGIGARNSTTVPASRSGTLHPDHVGDVRPDDHPRVGCLGLDVSGRRHDVREVEAAGHQQDGAAQLRQTVAGGGASGIACPATWPDPFSGRFIS